MYVIMHLIMPKSSEIISPQLAEILTALGATEQHIHSLNNPQGISFGEDQRVPYVWLNGVNGAFKPTIFYVPGFTENPISNAPLGVTLANQGFNVILPGNYSGPVERNAAGRKDALHTRAKAYSAIVKATRVFDRVQFVTHSMGSLVAQNMAAQATSEDHNVFEGASVVMLAPSGISDSDSVFQLSQRNTANLKQEKKREPQEFNDDTKESEKACLRTLTTNPLRSLREMRELVRRGGFDPRIFAEAGVASVALVGYANDPLYTDAHIVGAYHDLNAVDVPTTYVTPLVPGMDRMSATHNDEQANPSRVAPVVRHLLMV